MPRSCSGASDQLRSTAGQAHGEEAVVGRQVDPTALRGQQRGPVVGRLAQRERRLATGGHAVHRNRAPQAAVADGQGEVDVEACGARVAVDRERRVAEPPGPHRAAVRLVGTQLDELVPDLTATTVRHERHRGPRAGRQGATASRRRRESRKERKAPRDDGDGAVTTFVEDLDVPPGEATGCGEGLGGDGSVGIVEMNHASAPFASLPASCGCPQGSKERGVT